MQSNFYAIQYCFHEFFSLLLQIRPALPSNSAQAETSSSPGEEDVDIDDIDEEEEERVLVINHRENPSPETNEDSGREDSA